MLCGGGAVAGEEGGRSAAGKLTRERYAAGKLTRERYAASKLTRERHAAGRAVQGKGRWRRYTGREARRK